MAVGYEGDDGTNRIGSVRRMCGLAKSGGSGPLFKIGTE